MRDHDIPPARLAAQRLWLARAIAWALLLGGWLALGALGRQQLGAFAGGQGPVALWLLSIGGLLTLAGARRWSAASLRFLLMLAGVFAAAALLAPRQAGAAVLAVAVAWAALVVAASFTVRALRGVQQRKPPAPIAPALAGAVLAWALVGDLDALRSNAAPLGFTLLAAAFLLAALLPARMNAQGGCRSGLFDCSLPLLTPELWRHPAQWPLAAAALGMLPMMASLPVMADWCGALRWPAALGTALHLGAMLLPAACLSGAAPARRPALAVGMVLALGGAALLMAGLSALLAASLMHGVAWSLAWSAMLKRPRLAANAHAGPTPAPVLAAALTAVAVLGLGVAMDRYGPVALTAVHALLAVFGVIGCLRAYQATPVALSRV